MPVFVSEDGRLGSEMARCRARVSIRCTIRIGPGENIAALVGGSGVSLRSRALTLRDFA